MWLALPASRLPLPANGAEGTGGGSAAQGGGDHHPPKLKSRTLFVASTEPGVVVWAQTFYTRGTGLEKACVMSRERRSDTFEDLHAGSRPTTARPGRPGNRSSDSKSRRPRGMHRQYPQPGWIDPASGRMLVMMNDGVLPTDDPTEGMTHWSLRYRRFD